MKTNLLFTSRISSSSLYHLMVELPSTLKNWHQSFRCPEASGNGSPRILRITCGAGDAWKGESSSCDVSCFLSGSLFHIFCTDDIFNINDIF